MTAPLSLFHHRELEDAQARVDAAQEALGDAQRAYWFAPFGTRRARLKLLRKASDAALKAELALHALQSEAQR